MLEKNHDFSSHRLLGIHIHDHEIEQAAPAHFCLLGACLALLDCQKHFAYRGVSGIAIKGRGFQMRLLREASQATAHGSNP